MPLAVARDDVSFKHDFCPLRIGLHLLSRPARRKRPSSLSSSPASDQSTDKGARQRPVAVSDSQVDTAAGPDSSAPPVRVGRRRAGWKHLSQTVTSRPWLIALVLAGIVVAGGVAADYWRAVPPGVQATFVGRDSCKECHQEQSTRFTGSHHDLAMDVATDETVLGDFSDVTFEHDGLQNRLYRDGDKFMVYTEGPTGDMEDFEVKYVFGVDPLQQYMVELQPPTGDRGQGAIGQLQVLRISWDTHQKRWFYLRPPDVTEKLEPDDPLHWTGIAQRWQTMCADCHSTNLKTGFDVATASYHTTFSEIDVSCEACHGPGSLHVELARERSLFWDRHHGYGLAELKGEDPTAQLETCAPCHSRRSVLDASYTAGDPFCNHFQLELLRSDAYYDDGQIKDEVYVYGSFVQSKMYHKGIRCTDCHDPHSLQLKHPGNETCTSCHQHSAGKYDVPSHHHHAVGTEGAMCVNCHMPHTTYMEVDPRRDHSLRVPRPDLSVKLGTPNACSSCHVQDQRKTLSEDKRDDLTLYQDWLSAAQAGDEEVAAAIQATDVWCEQACQDWYGPQRQTPTHFAEILHGLRSGDPSIVRRAMRFVTTGDEITPVIARATALDELAATGNLSETLRSAKKILDQESAHPVLRATAARTFAMATPQQASEHLMPLLDDPSRLVRSEATRALARSGGYSTLSGSRRAEADAALQNVRDEYMVTADRAGAHLAWALVSEQRGDYAAALQAYTDAIRVEPETTGPRTNLAALLDRLDAAAAQQPEAARVLSRWAKSQGVSGDEIAERAADLRRQELPLLERDANLAPNSPEIRYRYGLSLYLAGRLSEAREQLAKAVALAPEVEQFRTALRLLDEEIQKQTTP